MVIFVAMAALLNDIIYKNGRCIHYYLKLNNQLTASASEIMVGTSGAIGSSQNTSSVRATSQPVVRTRDEPSGIV